MNFSVAGVENIIDAGFDLIGSTVQFGADICRLPSQRILAHAGVIVVGRHGGSEVDRVEAFIAGIDAILGVGGLSLLQRFRHEQQDAQQLGQHL